MYYKKSVILSLFLCFGLLTAFSQNNKSKSFYLDVSLDSLKKILDNKFSIKDYNEALDVALLLSNDKNDINNHMKGINMVGLLATSFSELVNNKKVDLDDNSTKLLLSRFSNEKYYIQQPKISRFIKAMHYLCSGDYSYVHQKLIGNKLYKAFLTINAVLMLLFCMCFSKKFKWKHKRSYIKLSKYMFIFFLVVFLVFNLTCQYGIKDYSFYGISM